MPKQLKEVGREIYHHGGKMITLFKMQDERGRVWWRLSGSGGGPWRSKATAERHAKRRAENKE